MTFEGNENAIKNLYMHNTKSGGTVGLFKVGGAAGKKIFKNLEITGTIINEVGDAGAISGGLQNVLAINCTNYADITGLSVAGGFLGTGYDSTIQNCKNYGKINSLKSDNDQIGVGGIIGWSWNCMILNCTNYGISICNHDMTGGIAGSGTNNTVIDSCINYGNNWGAGIVATERMGLTVKNCYNLGNCTNGIIKQVAKAGGWITVTLMIENCYNLGEVKESGIGPSSYRLPEDGTITIKNCYHGGNGGVGIIGNINNRITEYNISNSYYNTTKVNGPGAVEDGVTGLTDEEMRNQKTVLDTGKIFVEILNENIGENEDWKQWTVGANGYPVFVSE